MSDPLKFALLHRGRLAAFAPAWSFVLDQLYPPRCGGCDKRGTLLCAACHESVVTPGDDARTVGGIDSIASAGVFEGPLRNAIHNLKYNGDTRLAVPLAALSALQAEEVWQQNEPTLVPVPLHPSRKRSRGFNQSELLARELARISGLPVDVGLVRLRNTKSQVTLGAAERLENVAGAFAWRGGAVPTEVLLVDDVCTTGATLSECAAVLRLSGALSVCAITVARAIQPGGDKHP